MDKLFKYVTILAILAISTGYACAKETKKPDFAYPKQVSKQAESNLNKALKSNNGEAVVKSLIDLYLAQYIINDDSIQTTISRIEHVAGNEKNPHTKALLNTLLIEAYSSIYEENAFKYNQRTNVNSTPPADINEWGKRDFEQKVLTLSTGALIDSQTLKNTKLSDYNDIITHNNLTYIYYPTLYDFVASRIIANLKKFCATQYNASELVDVDTFLTTHTSGQSTVNERILSLYQDVISFHRNDVAPLINWDIERLSSYSPSFHRSGDETTTNAMINYEKSLNYLFKKYEYSEYATLALVKLWRGIYNHPIYSTAEFHKLFLERIGRFPAYSGNCEVRAILNDMEQKKLSISYRSQIVPNDTLKITINNTNCASFKIDILMLPDNASTPYHDGRRYYTLDKWEQPAVYKSIEVDCDSVVPFNERKTIETTISHPGYYTIVAYSEEIEQKEMGNLPILFCSEFSVASIGNHSGDNRIWILNPKNGELVTNADIDLYSYRSAREEKPSPDFSFKSSRKGDIKAKLSPNSQYYVSVRKGDDKFMPSTTLSNYIETRDTSWIDRATCFTSLPLYHPGDTVAWSGVVYSTQGLNQKLATGKRYTVTLRDANYMEIDTAIVTTDRFGRAEGKFTIPTGRLTGNYSIVITGKHNRNVGYRSFMVSDYKLPSFNIVITDVAKDEAGNYTVTGEARTYSGFALENANVSLTLGERDYGFWRYSPETIIYNHSTTTDGNGKFTFVLTPGIISKSGKAKAVYTVNVTATSSTGETQTASKRFTTGAPFYIHANLEATPIEPTKATKLDVALTSISGQTVDGSIHYMIINGKNAQTIKTGVFQTPNAIVDWSDVPSGRYALKLYSSAPTATDTMSYSIRLYRTTDPIPPIDEGLWLQHDTYTITKDNSIEIIYGATFDSGEILYLLYDDDKIHEQRWIKASKGIKRTRVFIPQHINEARLTLFAINGYQSYSVNASINRATPQSEIKIEAETFRDKIAPGGEERWIFKVTDKNGNGKESAMIMDMYSLAIEKLKPHSLDMRFFKPSIGFINHSHQYFNFNKTAGYSILPNDTNCPKLQFPQFNTYGMGFNARRFYLFDYTMEESETDSPPAPRLYSAKNTSATLGMGVAEVAEEEVAAEGGNTTLTDENGDIELRDAETPLAFFSPMLTTDSEGNLTYSFTAPNANTTWIFRALAYNNDMGVAKFAREVLSNKPLMVQPNMPRFLRKGDTVTIKANVMNNCDSTLAVRTLIEIFNPSTAKVIISQLQLDTITASGAAIAEIEVNANTDLPMLGYRIKAYTDNFGDGEQSLIPILPSTSGVIEAKPFYLNPGDKLYTQQLPPTALASRVTLEFCENPTWYIVTALPGLSDKQSRTATSAAMAIYSTAIADGIMRRNPQIANALYQWTRSDKNDSTLVSMLSRNQDLKDMLLSATPWVGEAQSDTERMTRLALLFDKNAIKATLDKNVQLLATLQRSGGGWAWIAENDKASMWATTSILQQLGALKKLGLLPDDETLNSMIENGVKFLDTENSKLFKEYPRRDYRDYVFTRDLFPDIKLYSANKRVIDATIQKIISDWKEFSVTGKATAAITLYNHGYSSTSREILKSIREYSQTSKTQGMWIPSIVNNSASNNSKILDHAMILDAFNEIEPSCKEIDLLRQWLIINKEANNWGGGNTASHVIYSILNSGSQWVKPAHGCQITLGNEDISPTKFDKVTGYMRVDLSQMSPSGKELSIVKHGDYPSWGAVYSQYEANMDEIKAVEGVDISITKRLLKQATTTDGDEWEDAGSCKVGDKVRIQLIIKAKRDIDYVTITDERAACFEPAEQLPQPIFSEGIYFYRENRDDATNIFVTNLSKGTYILNYDMYVNNEGQFASGIATIQSQYAPQITAHSAGGKIMIE